MSGKFQNVLHDKSCKSISTATFGEYLLFYLRLEYISKSNAYNKVMKKCINMIITFLLKSIRVIILNAL